MSNLKYQEIADSIRGKIQTCQLCPGDILPSESTLSSSFGMSRVSVRKGLSILTAEGYITPVAGKGYFVNRPAEEKCNLCFEEPLFIQNSSDDFRQLAFEVITADAKIARRLEIEEGERVVYVKYVYCYNGKPVAYDIKYIPAADSSLISPDPRVYINEPDNPTNIFSRGRKELHIWAALTTEEERTLLEMDEASPILVIEQIFRDLRGTVSCWSRMSVAKKYSLIAKS